MKKFIFLLATCFALAGCSAATLEKDKETVESAGLTYSFQLPKGWAKETVVSKMNKTDSMVFNAEDTNSDSTMYVRIGSKEGMKDIKKFAADMRQELADASGIKKVEDVYFQEYKVNEKPAIQFTVETMLGDKLVWSHLYYVFTDNGVIQFLYYSAQDDKYKKRAELIDKSVNTVKEVKYDKKAAAKQKDEKADGDEIKLETSQLSISIIGTTKIKDENGKNLFAIRYKTKNNSNLPAKTSELQTQIILKQNGKQLESGKISKDTVHYSVYEMFEKSTQDLEAHETREGVLLYNLIDDTKPIISFSKDTFGEKEDRELIIPDVDTAK